MAKSKISKLKVKLQNQKKQDPWKNGSRVESSKVSYEKKVEMMKHLQAQNVALVKQENTESGVVKKKTWKGGRHEDVVTPWVVDILRGCFAVGMNDAEACFFAKIAESSFYAYQTRHPEFLKEKEILKNSVELQAKLNIATSIQNKNIEDSKWWLSKKSPEFKDSWISLNISNQNASVIMTPEQEEKYKKILKLNNLLKLWNKETKSS